MIARRKKTGITVGMFARGTERELSERIEALDVAISETADHDRKRKLTGERDRLEQKLTTIQQIGKGT